MQAAYGLSMLVFFMFFSFCGSFQKLIVQYSCSTSECRAFVTTSFYQQAFKYTSILSTMMNMIRLRRMFSKPVVHIQSSFHLLFSSKWKIFRLLMLLVPFSFGKIIQVVNTIEPVCNPRDYDLKKGKLSFPNRAEYVPKHFSLLVHLMSSALH